MWGSSRFQTDPNSVLLTNKPIEDLLVLFKLPFKPVHFLLVFYPNEVRLHVFAELPCFIHGHLLLSLQAIAPPPMLNHDTAGANDRSYDLIKV